MTTTDRGKQVEIYTDGACKGNPGVGGWGALLCYGVHKKKLYGGVLDTTNNRMELMAVIESLKALDRSCQITLYTDSQYVKKGISEWLKEWKVRGWKTASKKIVKNIDLWQMLDREVVRHEITWIWIKGHAGYVGNEMADQLANQGILTVQQKSASL